MYVLVYVFIPQIGLSSGLYLCIKKKKSNPPSGKALLPWRRTEAVRKGEGGGQEEARPRGPFGLQLLHVLSGLVSGLVETFLDQPLGQSLWDGEFLRQ